MRQLPELPEIQIVETEALLPHEDFDEGRSDRVVRSLQSEGILKNPPAVLRIDEGAERYVVLDGANRTIAVRQMGLPHMLVQIANEGVEVRSWNHVLSEGDQQSLLKSTRNIPGVDLSETDEFRAAAALAREETLAYMVLPHGETWQLNADEAGIAEKVEHLTRFVRLYEGRFVRQRTTSSSLNGLVSLYPAMNSMVVFPQFSVADVIEATSSGQLFPSGLTRFLISPRALRLNFPLAMLADRTSIEEKRRGLEEWIRQRVEAQQVRYYAESTFVFDE